MAATQHNAFRGGQFDNVTTGDDGDVDVHIPTATDRRLAVALRNLRWVGRVTWYSRTVAIKVEPRRDETIGRSEIVDVRNVVEEYGTENHDYQFNDDHGSARIFVQNTVRSDGWM